MCTIAKCRSTNTSSACSRNSLLRSSAAASGCRFLPTNKSIDPLPYVRPATNADALLARPNGARKQSIVLPPNGFRWAPTRCNGARLTGADPLHRELEVHRPDGSGESGRPTSPRSDSITTCRPKAMADSVVERSQTHLGQDGRPAAASGGASASGRPSAKSWRRRPSLFCRNPRERSKSQMKVADAPPSLAH